MKALATIAAASAALAAVSAHAETTLKIACYLPPFSVSVTKILKPFADAVAAEMKGEVKFQEYWGGTLGRNPEQQYKLVTGGIADIAFISTYTSGGQFPDASITELPGLVKTSGTGSPAYWGMYEAKLLRGHDDIKTVSLYMASVNLLHTRKPIQKIEDIRGMKLQSSGPLFADFVKAVGGTAVYMPATELAQSLASGVVDGSTVDWTGFITFKLENLAHYHYEIPLGGISFVIAMNKDRWNALSPAAKAAIDKFGGAKMARDGGKAYDAGGEERRQKVLADKSHHDLVPSEAEQEAIFAKYGEPIYRDWIAKTPDGQKKFDTFKKLLADAAKM
jgi:TRAP-type C4-dicarboxylate transport system substrate-binding protein